MIKPWLLTVAAALLTAAPAQAGTAGLEPPCAGCTPNVTFRAAPGERNKVSLVHEQGSVVLRDAGAPLTPGAGCAAIEGGVRCATNVTVDVHLLDGDDVATVGRRPDNGLAAFVYGGSGDDRITGSEGVFSGGPGDDVVTGQSLWDDDGAEPGRDTYIGVGRTYYNGVGGAKLSYRSRTDGVRADLRPGRPSEDRISGVSALDGGKGDDTLIGDDQSNTIVGQEGDDRVIGNGGSDDLRGEIVLAGAGNDTVASGPGPVAPRCGAGHDLVLTGDNLVGEGCERVGANPRSAARPRMRLPRAEAAFLLGVSPCEAYCVPEHWKATAKGRVVATGAPSARSLRLNALGRRLLRREGALRVRVTQTHLVSPIEGGSASLERRRFRIVLRL